MPGATVNINISVEDLARLQDLPQKIETLARIAPAGPGCHRTRADASNPLGGVTGGLETLAGEAGLPRGGKHPRPPAGAARVEVLETRPAL